MRVFYPISKFDETLLHLLNLVYRYFKNSSPVGLRDVRSGTNRAKGKNCCNHRKKSKHFQFAF